MPKAGRWHAIVLASLAISVAGGTSVTGDEDAPPQNVVTRIYDVHDILYPRIGDAWAAAAKATKETVRELFCGPSYPPGARGFDDVSDLALFIELTQSEADWRAFGGFGTINYFDGQLIITQTAENHRAVKNFLAATRRRLSRSMVVKARWLRLTSAQLERFKKQLNESRRPGQKPPDDEILGADSGAVLANAQVACISGQPVTLSVLAHNGPGAAPAMRYTLKVNAAIGADADVMATIQTAASPADARGADLPCQLNTSITAAMGVPLVVCGMGDDAGGADAQNYLTLEFCQPRRSGE